jgi:pimeloyl-ACP methyl ester carboxylesterase
MLKFLVRAFGVLLMLTALTIPLVQAPDRAVETLVARWAPPPSDFIEIRGQLVHYRDQGPADDPTPLVLIHGTSASLHTWEGWVSALKKQRRVISFDLPGFGLTGPFSGQYPAGDYHAAAYARFVIDLLDALKLQQVVLAGNSLGGEIAWRVAALAPQRVQRLILVDAGGYDIAPVSTPIGLMIAQVPLLSRLMEHILPRPVIVASLREVYGDPNRVGEALVDRYFELALRDGNRHALGLRLQQAERGADSAQIATLRLPTLILWGRRDRLIPLAAGERFAAQIPGSRLVVFDTLGHVPQEEDPALSVAPVRAFLGLP